MKILCPLISSLFVTTTIATPALAQITVDGTTDTSLTPLDNGVQIDDGSRAGGNLFHSFGEFSVPTGSEAFFNNASDIVNIFSRVTGGNISNIDGLLRANGTANLFIINPAGIIFGEGARLDIGGSFYGTTADSIVFSNGEFNATDLANPPLITINAPLGLGIRDNPGDITVRGNGNGARPFESEVIDTQDALRVSSDATFGLVGGNLIFEDAVIKTAGGRIELGSVSGGQVNLNPVDNGFTFDYSVIDGFRDITLSGSSVVDAAGLGGGDIQVVGRNISITGVSGFLADTLGSLPGGEIRISASESLTISGVENENNFVSAISNRIFPQGTADGGDINIETGSLSIGDRALIGTSVLGQGNAGDVNINATESISLVSEGNNSVIVSNVGSDAIGNGGGINITTPSLTLSNGALFSANTSGQGNSGNITINATETVSLDGSGTGFFTNVRTSETIGNGGIISINSNSLTVNNGVALDASTSGQGKAGDIGITTTGPLTIDNSRLFTSSSTSSSAGNVIINASEAVSFANSSLIFSAGANGGSININAKRLELTSGSNFFAGINIDSGFAEAQAGDVIINLTEDLVIDGIGSENLTTITNTNFGTGNAGNIAINTRNVTFRNGGNLTSFNSGQGDIGDLTINATGDILFDGIQGSGRSGINNFVNEEGTGNVGTIEITAQNLSITNGGLVQSLVSGNANSGDININVDDTIIVDGLGEEIPLPSGITSNVFLNVSGDSGDININTQNLVLSRNGEVDTSILGFGNAGDININANVITIGEPGNSSVSPSGISSQVLNGSSSLTSDNNINNSNGGNITINTGSLSISDGGEVNAGLGGNNIGIGNGGNITINATDRISVDGTGIIDDVEIASEISSDILDGSSGNSGNITISTPNLSVSNNAFISSDVLGIGNSGNIEINTTELFLTDNTLISASVFGIGNSSNIEINTTELFVNNQADISASTFGEGNAGNLTINATDLIEILGDSLVVSNVNPTAIGNSGEVNIQTRKLTVADGAQILADTFGEGNAGNLTITATDLIEVSGTQSFISAGVNEQATGNSGNLNIQTGQLDVSDNGSVTVESLGIGESGNLVINANSINLDNNAEIDAVTPVGNGGSITLNIAEDITLRNNSFISARALEDANGGNLNINARFIIAFPSSGNGNDIIATAERGNGGNINLNARQIFNLQEGNAIDSEGNFIPNNSNDIDASSQTAGLDGTVAITNPDVDPLRGATELPANPVSGETIVKDVCSAGDSSVKGNSLIIQGKGGVLPLPTDPFSAEALLTDEQPIPGNLSRSNNLNEPKNPNHVPANIKPLATDNGNIYPARGIVKTADGKIILTAYPTKKNASRVLDNSLSCS